MKRWSLLELEALLIGLGMLGGAVMMVRTFLAPG